MNPGAHVSDTSSPSPALDTASPSPSVAADLAHNAAENLRHVDAQVRDFVVERPAVALLSAATIGFVVGRFVSRL